MPVLLMLFSVGAWGQDDSEYEKANKSITDRGYYRVYVEKQENNVTHRFYLKSDGTLTESTITKENAKDDAYLFMLKADKTGDLGNKEKADGYAYQIGWNFDDCGFTNPSMSNSSISNNGKINVDSQNRSNWERQVLFQKDGKYAVRATNATDPTWGAGSYWDVDDITTQTITDNNTNRQQTTAKAGYSTTAQYIWNIEKPEESGSYGNNWVYWYEHNHSIGATQSKTDNEITVVEFYSKWSETPETPLPFPVDQSSLGNKSKYGFRYSKTAGLPDFNGTYRISAQGFYRHKNGDGTNNNKAYLFVKKIKKSYNSSGLLRTKKDTIKYRCNLAALPTPPVSEPGNPNSMDEAITAFKAEQYNNDLYFTIDKSADEQVVEIGIEGYFDSELCWCIFNTNITYTAVTEKKDEGKRIGADIADFYDGDRYALALKEQTKNTDYRTIWQTLGWDGLIKMYLGGWKYQGDNNQIATDDQAKEKREYPTLYKSALQDVYSKTIPYYTLKSESSDAEYKSSSDGKKGTKQADYWKQAKLEGNFGGGYPDQEVFDGDYVFNSFAQDNGRSEYLATDIIPKYVHTFDTRAGEFGKGNPFTVPCFGGFLKFEPETNGKVELYVVQNGLIDLSSSSSDSDDGTQEVGIQNKITWRPTYIVDELGNFITDATADTRQKIFINKKENEADKIRHENSTSVTELNKFWDAVKATLDGWENSSDELDRKKAKVINDYWGDTGDEMHIISPQDYPDGWVTISKSYVKYTFDVKAGKSYYVFNNDSKIGFCGYEFKPEQTDWKAPIEINEENVAYPGQYKEVTLKRSFKPGWNAICLPFSVTESQMRKAFGTTNNEGVQQETYELVTYNGAKAVEDGEVSTDGSVIAHFFHHAYQDILAGYPYMLYIDKDADIFKDGSDKKTLTFKNILIEDDIEMATFNKSTDYIPDYLTEAENKRIRAFNEPDFTFVGNLDKTTVSKGSYVVYDGGIKYVPTNTEMKGLRSHLKSTPSANVGEVKRIVGTNFADIIDESTWNDATVINDLAAEMGFFSERENVYSVTGQLVRQNSTSLVGLPKGIYIVNGKKYFVK